MKNIFKIIFIALLGFMLSCEKSELISNNINHSSDRDNTNNLSMLSASFTPTTKVDIDGATIKWKDTDSIFLAEIFEGGYTGRELIFKIDGASISSDGKSADFYSDSTLVVGREYVALTGNVSTHQWSTYVEFIDYYFDDKAPQVTQTSSDNSDHLEGYWFMISPKFSASISSFPTITLRNVQSILSVDIKLKDGVEGSYEVDEVYFSSNAPCFNMYWDLKNDGTIEVEEPELSTSFVFINGESTISSSQNYIAKVPVNWNDGITDVTGDFTISVRTRDGKIASKTIPARALAGGKLYNLSFDIETFVEENKEDRAALMALYNATDGANWHNNTNWGTSEPIWKWAGVEVDANSRVSLLSLGYNNLIGTIPAEIGNLTRLELLYIDDNQLSGTIPAEIGNLVNLVDLDLGNNQLSGSIPTEIGNLVNLIDLRLGSNQLSGSIPIEIGSLSNLTSLYLGDNQLSGSIPTEIGNLSNLISLNLGGNILSGSIPTEIGNLTKLTYLWLSDNQLSGSIPTEIGSLSNLTALGLGNNQLSGSMPVEFSNLIQLGYVDVTYNKLSGNVPAEIKMLPYYLEWRTYPQQDGYGFDIEYIAKQKSILMAIYNSTNGANWNDKTNWGSDKPLNEWFGVYMNDHGMVAHLSLDWNNLVGALPAEVGQLTNLKFLRLFGNKLSSLPTEIGQLTNLVELRLMGTFSTIPDEIWQMTKLEQLMLDGTFSTVSTSIGNLSNLTYLLIRGNISSFPAEVSQLKKLTELNLSYSKLKNIPSVVFTLTNLNILNLESNEITSIPTSIRQLNKLTWLDLSGNRIESLPDEIWELKNLEDLDLSFNYGISYISPKIGQLTKLTDLNLRVNRISNIPNEIGNLNLATLFLNDNQLTSFPSVIEHLTNLQMLDLRNNNISRTWAEDAIPKWIGNLKNLRYFDISGNKLYGYVSQEVKNHPYYNSSDWTLTPQQDNYVLVI